MGAMRYDILMCVCVRVCVCVCVCVRACVCVCCCFYFGRLDDGNPSMVGKYFYKYNPLYTVN